MKRLFKDKEKEELKSKIESLEGRIWKLEKEKEVVGSGRRTADYKSLGTESEKLDVISGCVSQSIRHVNNLYEDFIAPSAIISYLLEKSYLELVRASLNGNKTVEAAMIENLRHISEVLSKDYKRKKTTETLDSYGPQNLFKKIEEYYPNIKVDTNLSVRKSTFDDRIHQLYLHRVREILEINLAPFYFPVDPKSDKVAFAN